MTETPYAFAIELNQPLEAAIGILRGALAAEQMGIVSEVDVQATLKAKLGLDSHPQKLLGVCNPQVAHALMGAEPDIAALLPCGCGVSEAVPGRTRIVLQDPRAIAVFSENPVVRATCEQARHKLQLVVQRLAQA